MNSLWWVWEELDHPFAVNTAKYHAHLYQYESKSTYNSVLNSHLRDFRKLSKDLRRTNETADADTQRKLSWAIFKRPYARRAAVMATARDNDRQDIHGRLKLDSLRELTLQFGKVGKFDPAPKFIPIPKSDGGIRPVWEFDRIQHAQQTLLKWIASAQTACCPVDFSNNEEQGIHGAAKAIAEHLSNGYRFWAITDIKTAFLSVGKTHLRALLELDERLVRYVACPSLLIPQKYSQQFTAANAPGKCLPQGAAHSSFILSALIDRFLKTLGTAVLGQVEIVVHSDNIAIGAHSMKEAQSAFFALEKAMREGLNGLPGGLMLHDPKYCDGYKKPEAASINIGPGEAPPKPTDFGWH